MSKLLIKNKPSNIYHLPSYLLWWSEKTHHRKCKALFNILSVCTFVYYLFILCRCNICNLLIYQTSNNCSCLFKLHQVKKQKWQFINLKPKVSSRGVHSMLKLNFNNMTFPCIYVHNGWLTTVHICTSLSFIENYRTSMWINRMLTAFLLATIEGCYDNSRVTHGTACAVSYYVKVSCHWTKLRFSKSCSKMGNYPFTEMRWLLNNHTIFTTQRTEIIQEKQALLGAGVFNRKL